MKFVMLNMQTHLWLHAGNIMIDGKLCKLSGYEEDLFRAKTELNNSERAGLADVGMLTGHLSVVCHKFS